MQLTTMPADRPHIILLMADQLRRDCLSCYGDLPVRTPHLDALAQESIVFDNAYCSTPLC
ncbi:MAG: sulfatase-like hydrolase/transferase, partial [Tepidisphaeraceae bacterium]